jgi:ankyrin repeat protein
MTFKTILLTALVWITANGIAYAADGTTALHSAAHENDLASAKQLLRAGADVDAVTDYGVSPLYLACTNRSSEMVGLLLDAGANTNAALWNGETVLMNCARTGATSAVEALLKHGANPNASESQKNQTAIMWAAAGAHGKVTELLVAHDADIKARSSGGFTPLLYAARSGDISSARALLDAGADPNESTLAHGNSLVIAAASTHEALALFLLAKGADPNSADEHGVTALHYSIANGMAALNGVRYDPVYRLIPDNMYELVDALLQAGANPNAQILSSRRLGPDGSPFDMEGATPFLLAAISADVELLEKLHSAGANPTLIAKGGTNALMAAARSACTGGCAFKGGNETSDADIARAFAAVKAVVKMGIDVDATNDDGQTAMHMAAFTGADPVVQYLAETGAKIDATDNYGETPWSMASGISPVLRYRGLYGVHQSTADLLAQLGAATTTREEMDSNAPPPPGQ